MFALLLAFLTSAFFLFRTLLILAGLLKGPVLQSFEKYGDSESLYFPVIHIFLWLPLFVLCIAIWVFEPRLRFGRSTYMPYCIVMAVAYLMYIGRFQLLKYAQQHPDWFAYYPRWYAELRDRTSRAERRRIAYMWLYLPWRSRLLYNSNDVAFLVWLDLVLLATIRPEIDRDPTITVNTDPSSWY